MDTVRSIPLVGCDHPNCKVAAEHRVQIYTKRGWLDFKKTCNKHQAWAKREAKKIED